MPRWNTLLADLGEFRKALYWSWLIVSVPLLAAITLPLIAPETMIDSVTPRCFWKTRFGWECPACGLTTAFIHIGQGKWLNATNSNKGSIPLYWAFVLNSVLSARSLIRLLRSKHVRC